MLGGRWRHERPSEDAHRALERPRSDSRGREVLERGCCRRTRLDTSRSGREQTGRCRSCNSPGGATRPRLVEMKKLLELLFAAGLSLDAALTRSALGRWVEGWVLTPFFIRLTRAIRGPAASTVAGTPEGLGRAWERLLRDSRYARVTGIDAESETVYGDISSWSTTLLFPLAPPRGPCWPSLALADSRVTRAGATGRARTGATRRPGAD